MALKSLLLVFLLVAVMAATTAQAQGDLTLNSVIRIRGTLSCSINGTIGANGTATPVFANALIQLMCNGNVTASSTTNGNGVFRILLDPLQNPVSSVLSGCSLKVVTPLSSCDANLSPVFGLLQSALRFVGNTVLGILTVIDLVPEGFQPVAAGN